MERQVGSSQLQLPYTPTRDIALVCRILTEKKNGGRIDKKMVSLWGFFSLSKCLLWVKWEMKSSTIVTSKSSFLLFSLCFSTMLMFSCWNCRCYDPLVMKIPLAPKKVIRVMDLPPLRWIIPMAITRIRGALRSMYLCCRRISRTCDFLNRWYFKARNPTGRDFKIQKNSKTNHRTEENCSKIFQKKNTLRGMWRSRSQNFVKFGTLVKTNHWSVSRQKKHLKVVSCAASLNHTLPKTRRFAPENWPKLAPKMKPDCFLITIAALRNRLAVLVVGNVFVFHIISRWWFLNI